MARSMSSRMTAADLPPSSRVQRAIRSPQMAAIFRPAAVEPVKVILSTRGVAHQELGDLPVGRDDVEHARGKADRLGDLGHDVRLAGSFGRRLEDDGAAGQQGGAIL